MNLKKYLILATIALLTPMSVYADNAVNQLLTQYRSQGADTFSAEAGKTLWHQEFTHKKTGKIRQCTTCHTGDLRSDGKHARTGKAIKPMAPSVNPERLTKLKKIRKWLKRNCKWTLGRECTPQEKGNILIYLQSQ
jgi:hypothetical protein